MVVADEPRNKSIDQVGHAPARPNEGITLRAESSLTQLPGPGGTPLPNTRWTGMAFTQLDPPLPLSVEGRGDGYAVAVIDYGQEFDLLWVVALNETGQIWCAPNPKVRMQANWSMGRDKPVDGRPKIAAVAS